MKPGRVYIGIDVGSASVNAVAVDRHGGVTGRPVYRLLSGSGSSVDAVKSAVSDLMDSLPAGASVGGVGTTGSGREMNRHLVGGDLSRTEIFAHAVGVAGLARSGVLGVSRPGTVIEIGGQDAKVIIFDRSGHPAYFNMNSICSAGTGEFLQQIADDAGLPLSMLGPTALRSTGPAVIDSTCTVFSRRDFRHLTQKGVALPDRLMGICLALVDNYMLNVLGTQPVLPPVIFQGGVASNSAVVAAFGRRLDKPVIVPPHHTVVGAYGMALISRDHSLERDDFTSSFKPDFFEREFSSAIHYCSGCPNACEVTQVVESRNGESGIIDTLGGRCERCRDGQNLSPTPPAEGEFRLRVQRRPLRRRPRVLNGVPAHRPSGGHWFAGIDGGSRGTKWAVLEGRADGPRVHAVGTLDTGADAISAIKRAVSRVRDALPRGAGLSGFGTTGSAGEMARDMITSRSSDTADYRSTEIISHYAWAAHIRPGVATVIDIGGNDSKLISAKEGGLDFAMNDKCAAGTGSFLESMARRFEVPIEDYGRLALGSESPARVAGRCAVFGESDLIHKARAGYPTADLLMGTALSVARTYLSDVAKGFPIRVPVVAQGGAFLNDAVARAFRELLALDENEFSVHTDPRHVLGAGALGAALLAMRQYERGLDTSFKGFDHILGSSYSTVSGVCRESGCGKTCRGLVLLLEDDEVIAGYRSIDCPFGLFTGMIADGQVRDRTRAALAVPS